MPTAPPSGPVTPTGAALTDGEWHRLHPATPLLRGGFAFVAILGVIIANLRERIIEIFIGSPRYDGDPIDYVIEEGLIPIVLLVIAVVLILSVLGFYLSWRFHTFRITSEVVEVRSGILFRTNRKARLDRIQGININRPFIARLFGVAKLEVDQAGTDANVQLAYLTGSQADDLRREILRLASGTRQAANAAGAPRNGGLVERRVNELLGPELEPDLAPPESVVKMHVGRLAGSIALSDPAIMFAIIFIGVVVGVLMTGEPLALLGIFPIFIGLGGYLISQFVKSLRYSIAQTADGVRVGFGLFSTTNETIPPGRIHSVSISQSLLWRPAGWWEIKVNRASRSSTNASQQQQRATILPVGNLDEAMRVIDLLLPGIDSEGLLRDALTSKGGDDGFVNSPRRAAVLRWFSWRRNGFRFIRDAVVIRRGAIWRDLVIVPAPRLQSVAVHQGPIVRALDLAVIHLHTVAGPISGRLGAIDAAAAIRMLEDVVAAAIASANSDTSHRWRSGESVT